MYFVFCFSSLIFEMDSQNSTPTQISISSMFEEITNRLDQQQVQIEKIARSIKLIKKTVVHCRSEQFENVNPSEFFPIDSEEKLLIFEEKLSNDKQF